MSRLLEIIFKLLKKLEMLKKNLIENYLKIHKLILLERIQISMLIVIKLMRNFTWNILEKEIL
jgi:hypothetical protein